MNPFISRRLYFLATLAVCVPIISDFASPLITTDETRNIKLRHNDEKLKYFPAKLKNKKNLFF